MHDHSRKTEFNPVVGNERTRKLLQHWAEHLKEHAEELALLRAALQLCDDNLTQKLEQAKCKMQAATDALLDVADALSDHAPSD